MTLAASSSTASLNSFTSGNKPLSSKRKHLAKLFVPGRRSNHSDSRNSSAPSTPRTPHRQDFGLGIGAQDHPSYHHNNSPPSPHDQPHAVEVLFRDDDVELASRPKRKASAFLGLNTSTTSTSVGTNGQTGSHPTTARANDSPSRGTSGAPLVSLSSQADQHNFATGSSSSKINNVITDSSDNMTDFDDEPIVPRSSKQAKMLGVGLDHKAPRPSTAGSSGHAGQALAQPIGKSSSSSQSGGGGQALDSWNGWGTKVGGPSSTGDANGASWSHDGQSFDHKGKTLLKNSPLRGARSASGLTIDKKSDGAPQKEKRKFGLSLFKSRNNKRDKDDGYASETQSLSEFAGSSSTPANLQLPAKLQARGDAEPSQFTSPNSRSTKRVRKPSTPVRVASYATPTQRNPSMFPDDPEISLDTNLSSMEGIVDFNALSSASGQTQQLTGAQGGGKLSRTASVNSRIDPLDTSRNGGVDPNHLFLPPGFGAGSRRGSFDPPSGSEAGSASGTTRTGQASSANGGGHHVGNSNRQDSVVSSGSGSMSHTGSGISHAGHNFWQHAGGSAAGGMSSVGTSSISPLTMMSSGATTPRPGMIRAASGLSVTGYNAMAAAHAATRGQQNAASLGNNGSTGGGSGTGTLPGNKPKQHAFTGAWTAPDSWAVKAEMAGVDPDTSDEEEDEPDLLDREDAETEEIDSENGLSPGTAQLKVFGEKVDGTIASSDTKRPMTSNGRPGTKAGRPATSDGNRGAAQKAFMIRIFRPDQTFSTLPAPLAVTASELTSILARRFQVTSKSNLTLYLREKGTERRVAANEKPVLLTKRRFEQAGYSDLDKLEELGREDNSYLCRLIYKPVEAPVSLTEDDIGESLEFVDLSSRSIETVPIFLYRHAHEIVSLNLSKNRPFDLPTDFVQLCVSLRELILSHMGIKRIPQAIKECYSLTRLDISNNHIVDLEHIALDELTELMSLKCHNNRLWTLPDYFSDLTALKYLNLSNNRFDSIPRVVPQIPSLVELDISFNTITTVPPEIGKLENLERLVLLANTINLLPQSLSELKHLKELDCRRNMISDLSPIASIPQLEVLRCEHNQASVLDGQWQHMRILSLSNNSLTRFALSGTGQTLTSLNLSFAKLSTLSSELFDNLGAVENLVLDSNQIRTLPDNVGTLTSLVHMSVKNNLLTDFPSSIGRLQRLQTLSVSGNNLATLPATIWLCSQLSSLNASSNLLNDFPDPPLSNSMESSVDELDTRKMSVSTKAPSTSSGRLAPPLAMSLQRLYLGDNQCTDDVFAPISLMTELRMLNLSFNALSEIPSSSLFRLSQLEELYLSGNKLTSLPPDDLERLVNLRLIYLNGNRLQTLPAELGKIKKLYALDVGSNVLKYNIANWPYDWNWNWNLELRYLNLSGNKRLEIKPGQQNDTSNLPRSAKRRNLADFSALAKLHVLGLMDVTLMIPSVPDESEDRRVRTSLSEINDMGYGIADTLGHRHDILSLIDIVVPRFRSKDDEAIFGLFDSVNKGQNTGSKLVKYLQDSFTAIFTLELSRLKSGEVTSDALRRAFLNINRDYGNMLLPALEARRKDSDISMTGRQSASVRTGAAGIIVYIRKKRIYVANAGNALAVISSKGGNHRLLSKRHDPFDAAEIARIRMAEGWISHRGYVNDEVDISRSFGFYNVFPAINASPNVEEFDLQDTDEFVIIANRGLWEHMSYQAAVDVARTERNDPMAAAAKLRDLAISYGSTQNIMVMVLAVGDLFNKTKKGYRSHRGGVSHPHDDEGFYGASRTGRAARGRGEEGAGERYLNLLDREVAPPVGMVALVFTDIRNSTALWESNPGMQSAIRMHNQLLRRQLRAIGGYEVKTEGDAFMVSFPTVPSALLWCLTVQLELLREDWPQEILDSEEGKEILDSRGQIIYRGLSVRMGIHWGQPVCEADPITRRMDYFGPMVNRSARIAAVAEGGQISCSQDVIDIIQVGSFLNFSKIRKDVVMESKPEPSSLDGSDDESDKDDDEQWLDPSEKQDVLALRRLGFGISELGERKLKGLETAEVISLIWPKALKERIKTEGVKQDALQAEVYDPSSQILDVTLVKAFGRVTHRLEAAAAAIVHRNSWEEQRSEFDHNQTNGDGRMTLARGPTLIVHPTTLAYPIRPDSSDDELVALLEGYLQRVENVLSTLVLHQLGPFTEILSALGQAVRTDPRSIMLALTRYAAIMGRVEPGTSNNMISSPSHPHHQHHLGHHGSPLQTGSGSNTSSPGHPAPPVTHHGSSEQASQSGTGHHRHHHHHHHHSKSSLSGSQTGLLSPPSGNTTSASTSARNSPSPRMP
ncbi:cysteinyl-tRNA synthetase [Microbotryomycetes sp. JL221]|nr:cysteinyl-tRNA synthetase [Microbotryomycetes sp. JL221]